jgi:hypothetical protein
MKPPASTVGTLLTWIHGGRSYAVQERNTDNHLQMRKISNHNKEDICILYFFYYIMASEEVMNPNAHPKKEPISQPAEPDTLVQWMNIPSTEREKDQRQGQLCFRQRRSIKGSHSSSLRWSSCDIGTTLQIEIFKFFWTFCENWQMGYSLLTSTARNFLMQKYDVDRKTNKMLFTIDHKQNCEAIACLGTTKIYKVDQETNTFEDHEISQAMWPELIKQMPTK